LGANLFLAVYLAYPKEQFITYASCQLIASSIVILFETPLLQHFLANQTETIISVTTLRIKALLAGVAGVASLEPMGLIADPILLVTALVTIPTSWQVTARTHTSKSLFWLLIVRVALLFSAFAGMPISSYIIVFSLVSAFCAYGLAQAEKCTFVSSVGKLATAYRAKVSFAIRPIAESIVFNAATVYVIKQLPTSEASLFYMFLRVIASTVSIAQNALYTESVNLRWRLLIERGGPMILATALIICLAGAATNYKNVIIDASLFVGAGAVVVLSQYFGSFRVKQLGLKRLDLTNGIIFTFGLAAICIISTINKSFESIAFTYIAVEAVIGLYSYRFILKQS
jgi:hypothetical protein